MERIASRTLRAFDLLNEALAVFMLLTTVVVVLLAVASRYVFNDPIAWTVEIARFAFIWLSFLGISIAERLDCHFRIDYFVDQVNPSARLCLRVFDECVVLFVLVMLLIQGIRFGRIGAEGISAVLELPLQYVYMALPISVALTIVNRLRNDVLKYRVGIRRRPVLENPEKA